MAKGKNVLTTGEVAKVCNVAPRTVSKWFDTGELRGYRIPGSKDRRIPLNELVRFMKAYGMPLDALHLGKTRVLVLDSDPATNGLLSETLSAGGEFEVSCARTAFEAGMAVPRFEPDVLVVDVTLPDVQPEQLCRDLRADEQLQELKLVGVSGALTEGQSQAMLQSGFDACVRKPFEVSRLITTIRELLER